MDHPNTRPGRQPRTMSDLAWAQQRYRQEPAFRRVVRILRLVRRHTTLTPDDLALALALALAGPREPQDTKG